MGNGMYQQPPETNGVIVQLFDIVEALVNLNDLIRNDSGISERIQSCAEQTDERLDNLVRLLDSCLSRQTLRRGNSRRTKRLPSERLRYDQLTDEQRQALLRIVQQNLMEGEVRAGGEVPGPGRSRSSGRSRVARGGRS